MDHLKTVHDAVDRAIDKKAPTPMVQCNFKVDPDYLDVAFQICERHGITLSEFLRCCIENLVDDYCPPQKNARKTNTSPIGQANDPGLEPDVP